MPTTATSPGLCTISAMSSKTEKPRDERIEFRCTAADKALIERAAELTGEGATSFARRAAVTEARVTIAKLEK